MKKLTQKKYSFIKKISGFSLIEVLVALLVLAIGMLGLAALQTIALKNNHGAYQRSQATFLAYDIIDRMRANRTSALAGQYDIALGASAASSPTTLAQTDVKDWLENYVNVLLPNGQGSIDCTTTTDVCAIVIQWDESRLGGTATSGSDTAQYQFSSEI